MNALSQIKDFEDFAAISRSEKWNKWHVLAGTSLLNINIFYMHTEVSMTARDDFALTQTYN